MQAHPVVAEPDKVEKWMEANSLPWDVSQVFSIATTVAAEHCDQFGHTNNTVYLQWLERVAWAHSEQVGLGFKRYHELGTGCVVRRHELDYLAASFVNDELRVGTWVADNDGRLSMWRGFQIIRVADCKTLLRARTHYVCVDLASGRPCRQPSEFVSTYKVMK